MWRRSTRCDSSQCVEVAFHKSSYSVTSDCLEVAFRKSSRSAGGNCVEVAFHKSSRSASNGACVEVGCCCDDVIVRDSKDPDGPRLTFGPEAWAAFVAGVHAGEFDRREAA